MKKVLLEYEINIILLHDVHNYKFKELSKKYNRKESSIKATYHRATKKFNVKEKKMSINKYIKEKENNDITYQMFKDKNNINIKNELVLNNKKNQNIFKSKPFKISIVLTILLLVISLSIININNIKQERIFKEDVSNILKLNMNEEAEKGDKGPPETFSWIIDWVIDDSKIYYDVESYRETTFYSVEIDINNSYIMCGYISKLLAEGYKDVDDDYDYISNLVWVRYDSIQDVKMNVEDLIITRAYFVYDILIKEDIINNIKYNKKCKYYSEIMFDSHYAGAYQKLNKEMLLWYYEDINEIEKPVFTNYEFNYHAYEAYTDNNGELNFIFISKSIYSNGITVEFLESAWANHRFSFYDELIKLSKECNQLNEMKEFFKRTQFPNGIKEQIYLEKVMISVSDIKKFINEKKNEKNN